MGRRRVALGVLVALASVAAAAGCGAGGGEGALCEALAAHPAGLRDIAWSNGITSGEATWGTVLGHDLVQADDAGAAAIGAAVRADRAGYSRLRAAAPAEARPALDRMRRLADDPIGARPLAGDTRVMADVRVVTGLETDRCGVAP
jgi:hypothetical protein